MKIKNKRSKINQCRTIFGNQSEGWDWGIARGAIGSLRTPAFSRLALDFTIKIAVRLFQIGSTGASKQCLNRWYVNWGCATLKGYWMSNLKAVSVCQWKSYRLWVYMWTFNCGIKSLWRRYSYVTPLNAVTIRLARLSRRSTCLLYPSRKSIAIYWEYMNGIWYYCTMAKWLLAIKHEAIRIN